jgi:predicted dehydrogenase
MSDKIRCLMVGMGDIGRHNASLLTTEPWYECAGIVDVCDAGLAAGKNLTALSDSLLFKDLGRALAEVKPDAVLINTPAELHFAQAKQSLEAVCHTLVAKPITNDFTQAEELVELARANFVTLCVAEQSRYNRHFTAVTQYVKSGALGSVEAAWFMNSKPRPNVLNLSKNLQPALYEMACHHFDAFLAVFEDRIPEWISCDGFMPSWSKYAGPCMVNALIRFSGNLHLAYHGGYSSQAPMYEFRLEGSRGALRCRGLHWSKDQMDYEAASPNGQFATVRIDEHVPQCNAFVPLLNTWHDYLCGGVEPPFSGRNNLKSVAMLSAAIESVESGMPIKIAENPKYAKAFEDTQV